MPVFIIGCAVVSGWFLCLAFLGHHVDEAAKEAAEEMDFNARMLRQRFEEWKAKHDAAHQEGQENQTRDAEGIRH